MNNSKPVVKIVKSGVRFNAWDANGNKFTSSINTIGYIYLVRDPRAIAVSFANHTGETIDQAIDSIISEQPRYVVSGNYPSWYFNWKIN